MTKEEAKKKIEHLEYYKNGFYMLSGCRVEAQNVRMRKDKVIADITFHKWEGEAQERYNNCEYPLEVLENISVK